MKKQLTCLLAVLSIFVSSLTLAQTNPPPAQTKKSDKIDALKVAFITKQLDLTPAEAEKFWPIYNQYQDEMQALNKSRMANTGDARPDIDNMSDADVSKMIENELAYEQQQVDIRKKYVTQFEKVLSVKKVAKLFRAEVDLKSIY